jgi:hypothetical protein
VAEHGVRGTARLLGMTDTQADTFRQRVARGKWMQDPVIAQRRAQMSPTVTAAPIVAKVSPVHAAAMAIQELSIRARTGHAKAAVTAAEHVATLDGKALLADANNVKALANHAATTFSWADQQPASRMRIDVLLQKPEAVTIECESQVVDAEWDNASATPI